MLLYATIEMTFSCC